MLVFIIGGLVILAYCSQASNERTYQEVVWAVCGKVPGVLCEVAIAIYTFGTCIAFLIIIGDQQDKSEFGMGGGEIYCFIVLLKHGKVMLDPSGLALHKKQAEFSDLLTVSRILICSLFVVFF